MSPAAFLLSFACALCLAQVERAADQPTEEFKGRVLEAIDSTVTVAVKAGKEPPVGTKVEIYIFIAESERNQTLGMGRVTAVNEGRVTVLLDSKSGQIEKNHL